MQHLAMLALIAGMAGLASDRAPGSPDARWPYAESRVSYNSSPDQTDAENQRNVVVDAAGAIHAVWCNMGSSYAIVYKRSTDGGATWTDSTAVSGVAPYSSANNRYPSLALDSTGSIHVVWSSAAATTADRRILHRERSSAGAWSSVTVLADSADNYWRSRPTAACAPSGRVHVVWITRYYDPTFVNYFYPTTRERISGTWQSPVNHSNNTDAKYDPAIAADRAGNVHITWREARPGSPSLNQVMYRKRTGAAWGTAVDVSQASYSVTTAAPSIAVDSLTPVIVFRATNYRVVLARDSAGTWLRDTLTPSGWSRYCFAPQVTAGPNRWIHVVYQGYSDSYTDNYQVRYGTWTPSDRWTGFEDATGISTAGRYTPSIHVDPAGDIHLLWYDGRDANNEIYYKRGLPPWPNDIRVESMNNVWPFMARNASVTVGVTVRNEGTTTRPPGVPVMLTITGPAGYSYADTVFTTSTLVKGASQSLSFTPAWTAPATKGPYRFRLRAALAGDQEPANDTLGRDVYVYPGLYETWSASQFPTAGWDTFRIAGTASPLWQRTTNTQYCYTAPGAAQFRSYLIPAGNVGALRSPRLDLTLDTSDSLIFYYHHPPYSGQADDSLVVEVSTDLGATWITLATYTGIDTPFSRKALNLESVSQTSQCHVRFTGRSRNHNYINIDDVMAPAAYVPFIDVAMVATYGIPSFPLVADQPETVAVTVRNLGRNAAGPFNVHARIDGAPAGSASVSGLAIGETRLVTIPVAVAGPVRRAFFSFAHDLAGDEVRANDTAATLDDWVFPEGTWQAHGFDWHGSSWPPAGWAIVNNDGGTRTWERLSTTGNSHSGRFYAASYFESSTLRNDDWLITPPFQPVPGLADSFGLYYRCQSLTYPESIEVWVMRGGAVSDTIARLFAARETTQSYQSLRLNLDAWDDSTVRIGIRNRGLDRYYLLVDNIWWRRTLSGPGAPLLALPPNGAAGQPAGGALIWRPAAGAQTYEVYLDTLNPPVRRIADNLSDTTVAYDGLLPLRDYYWSVTARNSVGATGSAVWSFRTGGTAPVPPGWSEVLPGVPIVPSGRTVKDGGWLAFDALSGRIYVQKGNKAEELHACDVASGSWAALAPMPLGPENKPPHKGAVGAADGNGTLYVVKGNNTLGFYKYVTQRDSWSALAEIPPGPSGARVKGGADLACVDEGDSQYVYLLKGGRTEFYRYNVATNAWQSLPDAPAGTRPKWDAGSWLVHDGAGTLYAHKSKVHDFFSYSVAGKTWGPARTGMPVYNSRTGRQKKAKDGSDGVLWGGFIYALKGGNTQDFYRYELATGAWTECETLPAFGSTGKKKRVKAGGSLTVTGDWEAPVLALKGNKTLELWRYTIGTAQPAARAARAGIQADKGPAGSRPSLTLDRSLTSGAATVRWSGLAPAAAARLAVYEATGRLVLARQLAGSAAGALALDLPSGVYAVRLTAPGFAAARKLVVHR